MRNRKSASTILFERTSICLVGCSVALVGCSTGFKRTGYSIEASQKIEPSKSSNDRDGAIEINDATTLGNGKVSSNTKMTNAVPAQDCKVAIKYNANLPASAKKIGEVEAYDPFWLALHCCEDVAMSTFVKDACAIKANVVNIVKETPGSIWHCYEAKAELLVVDGPVTSDDKYTPDKILDRSQKMDKAVHAMMTGAIIGGVVGGAIAGSVAK